MTKKNHQQQSSLGILMLTSCSFIWGTAFIAQSVGSQYVGPLTFNASRTLLAMLFLFPCVFLFDKLKGRPLSFWGTENKKDREKLWRGGMICGLIVTIESLLQQMGIAYTTVGKSGFITSLYIVIVPVLGYFIFKHSVNLFQCCGVVLAIIGMYFICLTEDFTVNKGDMLTLGSAFFFALHIFSVEHFASNADGVRLSFFQFATCAVLNTMLTAIFETPSIESVRQVLLPVCYAGIMSSGIAYTLQIVGQKRVNTVLASILLSLESVFALISGWLILGQVLTGREIFGCVLVFAAIMLAQLPPKVLSFAKHKATAGS